MAFLMGLYGGGSGSSRRRMAAKGGRRSAAAVAAPRPMRQLYWKLRSRLRPKRHAGGAVRSSFGYDLQSYSRNFDDGGGLVSGAGYRSF